MLKTGKGPVTALVITLITFSSCDRDYNAAEALDKASYDNYFSQLSPYILDRPDEISFQERFDKRFRSYYNEVEKATGARLTYYHATDTAKFFFYHYKDVSSLFEHYRGMGGYFRTDGKDSINFVNLLYFTPRFTSEEMEEKGRILFQEMVDKGNVEKYIGDRKYIHTPNQDFYYNSEENRWDYTENSSWKFLQEEQQRYDSVQ